MREILFRGKRIDNGEWVEGNLNCCAVVGETHIQRIEGNLSTTMHKIDPETICQYTGLTDKNGRKIFEGDIVECLARKDGYDKYKVVWCKNYADFRIEPLNFGVKFPIADYDGEYIQGRKYLVIGNIFDNPALLEGNYAARN